jgi:hypothetical protein
MLVFAFGIGPAIEISFGLIKKPHPHGRDKSGPYLFSQ